MLSELRTMWEVLKHTFTKAETVEYPEQMPYLAPRYRGRIVLTRDPDGEERCVACNLCAAGFPDSRIPPVSDAICCQTSMKGEFEGRSTSCASGR